MWTMRIIFLSTLVLTLLDPSGSLSIIGLDFPPHVMVNESVQMSCKYYKDPASEVDSIKWYKDNKEFYRLHPSGPLHDRVQIFQYPGININKNTTQLILNVNNKREIGVHKLCLHRAEISSSGNYRCQITDSKAPFHTEQQDRKLTVIVEPEKGPSMTVSKDEAELGEEVQVQCISYRSKPAANLQFFINDQRVQASNLGDLEVILEDNGRLETSYRTLTVKIRPIHMTSNFLRVKCTANIGEAYWRSAETGIRIRRKSSKILESRSSCSRGIVSPLLLGAYIASIGQY